MAVAPARGVLSRDALTIRIKVSCAVEQKEQSTAMPVNSDFIIMLTNIFRERSIFKQLWRNVRGEVE